MSIDTPIPPLPAVEYSDVLKAGADKINNNIESLRTSYNSLRDYTLNLVVDGGIDPDLLDIKADKVSILDSGSNFDSDNVEGALVEVVSLINSILSTGGSGDVVGPAASQPNRIALFQGTTGKVIHDSGVSISQLATSAQGSRADTAVQPGDLSQVAFSGSYNDLSNTPAIPAILTPTNSIQQSGSNIRLVGDTASPAAGRYYGTDATGARGWHALPEVGGGSGTGTHEISLGNVSGNLAINLDGNKQVNAYGTITGATTLSFTNVPTTGVTTVTLVLTQSSGGGNIIAYPGGTQFLNGNDGSINPLGNSVSVVTLLRIGTGSWRVAVADTRVSAFESYYFNPGENGTYGFVSDKTMTLDLDSVVTSGTGSLAHFVATDGENFNPVSGSVTLQNGHAFRSTVSGMSGWFAYTIPRTA